MEGVKKKVPISTAFIDPKVSSTFDRPTGVAVYGKTFAGSWNITNHVVTNCDKDLVPIPKAKKTSNKCF